MTQSVLDLFSIGIGPSSSHTIGPMRAALLFSQTLASTNTDHIRCELYGSLALTGKGHGTAGAITLGLSGFQPEAIDTKTKTAVIQRVTTDKTILIKHSTIEASSVADLTHSIVHFDPALDIIFLRSELLPLHSNGMKLSAYDNQGKTITSQIYYSVGGGFICDENGQPVGQNATLPDGPYPFASAAELMRLCQENNLSISQLVWENERTWHDEASLKQQLLKLWEVMNQSIESGLVTTGILPGGLKVNRRAPQLYQKLLAATDNATRKTAILDWLSVYAMAVNEENAAGGRVVTAPTNGAAGIIPAVLKYYFEHLQPFSEEIAVNYLLTAGAIGLLYKEGASLSAAEVGCQGEVGVACSMAAGALAAIQGGTIWQIENAAEIGMEHNLGLTCDPIGGLVQIPCIERNTMGAVKAVNAAHLALNCDGKHIVSLDKVIATMMRTGKDMQHQYKETSLGGLAVQVNMPEC